ncbi:hypothetical protein [Campylobacter sputorum]|uniref:hypothetical protein n=1 Tax=Campylobacter sputorum TaxID=206 RepID=UPI000B7751C7|nr:hypothetical protein [Campylobacter sputorum]ASM36511.1 hypothetical protein CSF_0616 [Campylobacter sputorum bv. faecalis CCUG 20703]
MTILWVIALFLAIPTYGISIIAAIILSFIIIKANHQTYNEKQTLESYSRAYAVNKILEKERIFTNLNNVFLNQIYEIISTEINIKLKYLSLNERTNIIIKVFSKVISECDDDVYKAIKLKDEIIKKL